MALLNDPSDELAIRDLVARYCDAVNCRRPGDLADLFTEDGEWFVPGVPDTRGAAIPELLAQLLEKFDFLVQTPLTGRVVIDGDTARARFFIAEVGITSDGIGSQFYGVYHDRLVKQGDRWRFASRRFDFTYRGRLELGGKVYPFSEPEATPWLD